MFEKIIQSMPEEIRLKLENGDYQRLVSDREQYERLRVQWANSVRGKLPGEDCPKCLNRGYITELRDGYHISVECSCMAKRRSLRRMEQSGLGDMLRRYTLENYQTPEKWQEKAKALALDYLRDHEGKWFIAAGSVGCGKTHLCTAICGELLNAGVEVRYMLWRDDGNRIKASVNDPEQYRRLVKPLKTVPVLYIDDFFKVGTDSNGITKGDINLAFEILNARYNDSRLITILSSEWTIEHIMDIDEAVGSRIYERSKDYYLRLTGKKNWRLRG